MKLITFWLLIPALFFTFGYRGFEQEIISHMVIGTSLGIIVFSSIALERDYHFFVIDRFRYAWLCWRPR